MRAVIVYHRPPHGKGRPRWVPVGDGSRRRMITPPKTRAWEGELAALVALHPDFKDQWLTGPVRVDVLGIAARPRRLRRRSDPDGLLYRPHRPDADNVRKAVLDALRHVWSDDAQVVAGETISAYAERDGEARVVVAITDELDPIEELVERLGMGDPKGAPMGGPSVDRRATTTNTSTSTNTRSSSTTAREEVGP